MLRRQLSLILFRFCLIVFWSMWKGWPEGVYCNQQSRLAPDAAEELKEYYQTAGYPVLLASAAQGEALKKSENVSKGE